MTLETENLILRTSDTDFARQLLDYYVRNCSFLKEFEPQKVDSFYTYEAQSLSLQREAEEERECRSIHFYLFPKNASEKIIGSVGLNNIVLYSFCSCFLGYKLDEEYLNRGYMTQAIRVVTHAAFHQLGLHRIEANIMPRNKRSQRVVEKCGFIREGLSRKYLKINGVWEDHLHFVLLNESL